MAGNIWKCQKLLKQYERSRNKSRTHRPKAKGLWLEVV
jgi:hypothetical protein